MPSVSLSESALWFLKQIQTGKGQQKILLIYDPSGKIFGNIHVGRKAFPILFHEAVGENGIQRIFCEKFTGIHSFLENRKSRFRNLGGQGIRIRGILKNQISYSSCRCKESVGDCKSGESTVEFPSGTVVS